MRFFLPIVMVLLGGVLSGSQPVTFPSQPGDDPWLNRPNDPRYLQDWQLYSHFPLNLENPVDTYETSWGSGMHVDRAWQLHLGTPEAIVAITDSGIYWENTDLRDRILLNQSELPLPEGSKVYDKNGDGRFSVSDYDGDSRVSDVNKNGIIDAGDLIKIFSNGIDEDNNGYIDDIAGWDFFENDNDPADRTRFGHGTSQAKDSVAAINNGIGSAGICGDCSLLPLRLDDSFVVDANAYARAVIYATDRRVTVIQQALGSVNWTPLTQIAIDYAYDMGTIIIGSAADENSFHNNYPATLDPVIYANAIRSNNRDYRKSTTFLNFNNCSNYGARVDVSVSGESCSSEATANLAGMTALAASYAMKNKRALSPGEMTSLIKMSADDINRGPAPASADRHATYPGWDTMSGYGRANAFTMLDRIRKDQIPPEARIISPKWFDLFANKSDVKIPVRIRASAATGPIKVKLEVAAGAETSDRTFETLVEKEFGNSVDEIIFEVDPLKLKELEHSANDHSRNHFAYTLKLSVEAPGGMHSESRRTFFVYEDKLLYPGFPRRLIGSGESSGYFADLNHDGAQEYVTADGGGGIHAFTHNGKELPGFPAATAKSQYRGNVAGVMTEVFSSIFAPIAGGDIDGDGGWDIVAASLEGNISVIQADGSPRPGFPIDLPTPAWDQVTSTQVFGKGVMASPVVFDLDNDGLKEIIVAALDGFVHVYRHDGQVQPGFPVRIEVEGNAAKLVSSPALIDLDKDGIKDLVLGSNHYKKEAGYIFAVNGKGTLGPVIAGFPVRIAMLKDHTLPTVGSGIPAAPAVGDIDGDGTEEIIVHGFVGKIYVLTTEGKIKKSMNSRVGEHSATADSHMLTAFAQPAIADITGDGTPEVLGGGTGRRALTNVLLGGTRFDYDHLVGAWNGVTGMMLPNYPQIMDDMQIFNSPVAANVFGDDKLEMLMTSGGYYVRVFNETGEIPSMAKFTGGWIFAVASVGDFDGDGLADIATTTREGYVFIWKTTAKVNKQGAWPTYKANAARTGVYHAQ